MSITSYTWTSSSGGDWAAPANWTGGDGTASPGVADSAVISATGVTVTAVNIDFGAIQLTGTGANLQMLIGDASGALGTIDSTFSVGANASLTLGPDTTTGAVDPSNSIFTIAGGGELTNAGTVALDQVAIDNALSGQTIDVQINVVNTGTLLILNDTSVVFDSSGFDNIANISAGTLTNGASGVVNILGVTGGGGLTAATVTNAGLVDVTEGSVFSVSGSLTNKGTISLDTSAILSSGTDANLNLLPIASLPNSGTIIMAGTSTVDVAAMPSLTTGVKGTIEFADGSAADLIIATTGTASYQNSFAQNIINFQAGNTIDLAGHGYSTNAGWSVNGDILQVSNGASIIAKLWIPALNNLTPTQLADPTLFTLADDGSGLYTVGGDVGVGGIQITTDMQCFVAGTKVATPRGPVAVEALRVGDDVVVASVAGTRTIRWIGHRRVMCLSHPSPESVMPVRIAAHAFGAGVPFSDVYLSPDHAVLVDDGLVPIKLLCNGTTIARTHRTDVTYWHIELDEHDVVFAEGLPAESFLDCGARDNFESDDRTIRLHPAFDYRRWEMDGCAPLVLTGPRLRAARDIVARNEPVATALRAAS